MDGIANSFMTMGSARNIIIEYFFYHLLYIVVGL